MEKGKKIALLVGCNYRGSQYELHGCQNDVLAMREMLVTRFGFEPSHVEILMDKPGSQIMPTGANIKKALNNMVDQAKEGDVLFFHYSGHGTLIKPKNSIMKEEAIVPSDFNLITSLDFRQLVNRVPKGATFTILSDSCHSGGLIDKETEQIGPSATPSLNNANTTPPSYKQKQIPIQSILQHLTSLTSMVTTDIGPHLLELFGTDASPMFHDSELVSKPLKPDEGILLSGCQTNETSADVEMIMENGRMPCGAFSNAVHTVLKENAGPMSNKEVVLQARKVLMMQHFNKQHPCLYCSDENADAIFLEPARVHEK